MEQFMNRAAISARYRRMKSMPSAAARPYRSVPLTSALQKGIWCLGSALRALAQSGCLRTVRSAGLPPAAGEDAPKVIRGLADIRTRQEPARSTTPGGVLVARCPSSIPRRETENL
jgi:hypothetical protein